MEKPAQWALVGAAWFLALTVAAIGFFAWRTFEANGLAKPSSAAAQPGAEAPLQDGATAICPVTHETVVVGPSTPRVVYMDRVYYFSNTQDLAGHDPKRRFLMDPESFVHPGLAPTLEAGPLPTLVAAVAPSNAAAAASLAVPTPVPSVTVTRAWPTAVPTLAAAPPLSATSQTAPAPL
jgi:hypothetical protein